MADQLPNTSSLRAYYAWERAQHNDRTAIPTLIPMLGSWSLVRWDQLSLKPHDFGMDPETESVFLRDLIAAMLRQLGADSVVDTFFKVLRGVSNQQVLLSIQDRTPFANALMNFLPQARFSRAANAARALGALSAFEATGVLHAMSMRHQDAEVRGACQEAIKQIGMPPTLPRAAEFSPSTDTLPRATEGVADSLATLPRVSQGDGSS